MSHYFNNFSLDKITATLNTAAQKTHQKFNETQEHLSHAIQNIKLDDPQTILSLKTRKRQLQETLGSVKDISKLPPQYEFLERKCDSVEKVCKKILTVTKTFAVDGYDYPPNLTESISDWWGASAKDAHFLRFGIKGAADKQKEESGKNEAGHGGTEVPSFAHALYKAADSSRVIIDGLAKHDENVEATDDETDEDVEMLSKMFETWADAQYNIDAAKQEMDQFMVKEFNQKLATLIEVDFKNVHYLRRKVEECRLKFDTLRYEQKNKEVAAAAAAAKAAETIPTTDADKAKVVAEDASFIMQLEEAEDEFVSRTTEAVEFMAQITDATKLISLIKLFHNFQLVYYKKCVLELQSSLSALSALGDI